MATAPDDAHEVDNTLRAVLADVLGLDRTRVAAFDETTPLFAPARIRFAGVRPLPISRASAS